MSDDQNHLYSESYLAYQKDRSAIRKWVRLLYIRHAIKHLIEPVIDLGCGIGEHLAHLGKDSIGLEVNQRSVDYCLKTGLNVEYMNTEEDQYQLSFLESGRYNSMLISHVLEHLDNPDVVFRKLLFACDRLGVKRIFVCVPGIKGFAHDTTHRTFIDKKYLEDHGLVDVEKFQLVHLGYFPVNLTVFGKYFTHNEMNLTFERK